MRGYGAALLVTLAVEPPVLALAWRLLGAPAWRGYAGGALGNAACHPLTWLVLFPALAGPLPGTAAFVAAELGTVAGETLLLRLALGRDLATVLGAVLVANGLSLAAGAALL